MRRSRAVVVVLAGLVVACVPPAAPPLPENSFAFGVFGDGPYYFWEQGRFKRLLEDVSRTELAWLVHLGDLFWYPCSDANLGRHLDALNTVRHPVVYTPGDNEWADCHEVRPGGYAPLDRLARIRTTYFEDPRQSVGGLPMPVATQSDYPDWGEFVENAQWTRGGFRFATVHMVGSQNASAPFPTRTQADDDEVARRTQAALNWVDAAFATARADSLSGVVLTIHGDPGFGWDEWIEPSYADFLDRLAAHTASFGGPVLLIHGDSHEYLVDHPLMDPTSGAPLPNFTRLETFGSPDIGWVRVVVDTVQARFVAFEPRVMPSRLMW